MSFFSLTSQFVTNKTRFICPNNNKPILHWQKNYFCIRQNRFALRLPVRFCLTVHVITKFMVLINQAWWKGQLVIMFVMSQYGGKLFRWYDDHTSTTKRCLKYIICLLSMLRQYKVEGLKAGGLYLWHDYTVLWWSEGVYMFWDMNAPDIPCHRLCRCKTHRYGLWWQYGCYLIQSGN